MALLGWGAVAVLAGCHGSGSSRLAVPVFAARTCVEASEHEREVLDAAARAIELQAGQSSALLIGAEKLMGHGLYREIGKAQYIRVCTPPAVLQRVGAVLQTASPLGPGRLEDYELELAEQLPSPSDAVIGQIAESAFNEQVQPSEFLHDEDIRPYARTVLATFGMRAERYRGLASRQMSNKDGLGTGATQVLAATDPSSLPSIVKLFKATLAKAPPGRPIPIAAKERLHELGWALYFAGEAGRAQSGLIREVMNRQVESRSMFGLLSLQPKSFCRLLKAMEGDQGPRAYQYCDDPSIPFDD